MISSTYHPLHTGRGYFSLAPPLLSLFLSLCAFPTTALLGHCSNLSLRKDKDETWCCQQDIGRPLMRYHILNSPQLSCVAGEEALISIKSKFHCSNSSPPHKLSLKAFSSEFPYLWGFFPFHQNSQCSLQLLQARDWLLANPVGQESFIDPTVIISNNLTISKFTL